VVDDFRKRSMGVFALVTLRQCSAPSFARSRAVRSVISLAPAIQSASFAPS
jgi:hypothetical protein